MQIARVCDKEESFVLIMSRFHHGLFKCCFHTPPYYFSFFWKIENVLNLIGNKLLASQTQRQRLKILHDVVVVMVRNAEACCVKRYLIEIKNRVCMRKGCPKPYSIS